jgi:hypothetical protein
MVPSFFYILGYKTNKLCEICEEYLNKQYLQCTTTTTTFPPKFFWCYATHGMQHGAVVPKAREVYIRGGGKTVHVVFSYTVYMSKSLL